MESHANNNETQNNSKDLEDSGITMVDVLQEEEDLENDADAVLGAGDDSSCTYHLGYMKRQPLYACVTCCPVEGSSLGGICLGCSYHCHEGHELVELYTKRYFKCDCGTSKFPEANKCKLYKEKPSLNTENCYNQNFKGKYCTCSRPYPDPDDTVEDSMIQCIICEDWYHGRHLKVGSLPNDEEFSEMICHLCVVKLPFLKNYLKFIAAVPTVTKDEDVDVTTEKNNENISEDGNKTDHKASASPKKDESDCKLKSIENCQVESPTESLFLVENWRAELCTCSQCKEMYEHLRVSFLTDPEDTVSFYESEGRAKRLATRGVQRELDALSSLDRITRTEVVHEYNNLSTSLREYLRKFAENGKVVRDEDIREFFSQLSANKKRKPEGLQYFCK